MGKKEEACERMIETLEEAINTLEKAKEECTGDWDLFPPDEIEEVIEKLAEIVANLNLQLGK
jgi:sugar-specific transcriptional regulator TrmB